MADVSFSLLVQRGCGIDVHLKVVVATINGEGLKKETRSFGTFTSSLTELKEWLLANGITHVAMESTSVYWKLVYKVLEGAIENVWIVNALIDMLCEDKKLTLDDTKNVYHGKLAASPEELLETCTGFVEFHHVYMLQIIKKHITQTLHMIDSLNERIK